MAKILVTGGMGFIGSHVVVKLLSEGHEVSIIDNLHNSEEQILDRIKKITGKTPFFSHFDLCERQMVSNFFRSNQIDAVVQFAAFKASGESVMLPLEYYYNNLLSLKNIISAMRENNVKALIFPSSACVYGDPDEIPVCEQSVIKEQTNPYGSTKIFSESIIKDSVRAYPEIKSIMFRFFNAAGAHKSGIIGELPKGTPNNLMPYIAQTAAGIREELKIFGNDWNTPDGYCVRDYIHVDDLADAISLAIERILNEKIEAGHETYNLGVGRGYSVKEVVDAFEKVNKINLNKKVVARRTGDIAAIWADCNLAKEKLGWVAKRSLEDIVGSAWEWEKNYRVMR